MSRVNEAKVKRLSRAAEVIESEIKELVWLPDDLLANLKGTLDFLSKRCEALMPEEVSEVGSDE